MIIRVIAIIIIPLGTMVFLSQWQGANWGGSYNYPEAVRTTAGAVIGMIPSGLFLMTSISLAAGVLKLAKHRTIVHFNICCLSGWCN